MKTKICTKCGEEKLLDCFYADQKSKDGKQYHCKDCEKKRYTQYYEDNKDRIKKVTKAYKEENEEYYKNYLKEYGKKNKKKRNKYLKDKYDNNIQHKLTVTLRTRIITVLKRQPKNKKTLELLGCSLEFFKKYIEDQFLPGMTWDNHGRKGWHLDHKNLCIFFDLSDPKQQEICFHYTNFQPLWWKDNLTKARKNYKVT